MALSCIIGAAIMWRRPQGGAGGTRLVDGVDPAGPPLSFSGRITFADIISVLFSWLAPPEPSRGRLEVIEPLPTRDGGGQAFIHRGQSLHDETGTRIRLGVEPDSESEMPQSEARAAAVTTTM